MHPLTRLRNNSDCEKKTGYKVTLMLTPAIRLGFRLLLALPLISFSEYQSLLRKSALRPETKRDTSRRNDVTASEEEEEEKKSSFMNFNLLQ